MAKLKKNIKLLIIDPFVVTPENDCFNHLVTTTGATCYIWQPRVTSYEKIAVDGYIVLGSSSHAAQNLIWQKKLSKFLLSELKNGKPVLGLCFGHQLMAYRLGGEVDFVHASEKKITGSRIFYWENESYQLGVSHRQVVLSLGAPSQWHHWGISPYQFDILEHKKLPLLATQAHPEGTLGFLTRTCKILQSVERKKCLKDGERFILKWMQKYF